MSANGNEIQWGEGPRESVRVRQPLSHYRNGFVSEGFSIRCLRFETYMNIYPDSVLIA